VWTGIPEKHIIEAANTILIRNLLLMLLALGVAILTALTLGKSAIITPINSLIKLTGKFSRGQLDARSDYQSGVDELLSLTKAFHNMAATLQENHKILRESEARFRHLMNKLDALVYVIEPNSRLVMFINEYGKKLFGDVTGRVCWKSIQQGLSGPCEFCPNKNSTDDKQSGDAYAWEGKNTITGKWFQGYSRTIDWPDGHKMVLLIATDITTRKEHELVKEALIEKLEKALSEIRTLQGILPICSFCKKIRNDEGYYEQIESYFHKHSDVDFSHTICPICMKKHYPEEYEDIYPTRE
jgi:PAS domain-containing protein